MHIMFSPKVCVCVCFCVFCPHWAGQSCCSLFGQWVEGGGVEVTWVYSRILAIGPKTEKKDQKSFLEGQHTRAASVNKTTND